MPLVPNNHENKISVHYKSQYWAKMGQKFIKWVKNAVYCQNWDPNLGHFEWFHRQLLSRNDVWYVIFYCLSHSKPKKSKKNSSVNFWFWHNFSPIRNCIFRPFGLALGHIRGPNWQNSSRAKPWPCPHPVGSQKNMSRDCQFPIIQPETKSPSPFSEMQEMQLPGAFFLFHPGPLIAILEAEGALRALLGPNAILSGTKNWIDIRS